MATNIDQEIIHVFLTFEQAFCGGGIKFSTPVTAELLGGPNVVVRHTVFIFYEVFGETFIEHINALVFPFNKEKNGKTVLSENITVAHQILQVALPKMMVGEKVIAEYQRTGAGIKERIFKRIATIGRTSIHIEALLRHAARGSATNFYAYFLVK